VVPPHDRAPGGRVAPVTPWPSPWSVTGRRFRRRHAKLAGVPKPAGRPRSRPPRTTPPAQAAPADREHLHGHNGVLDLLRRAARWRAHPPGWGCPTRTG